MQPGNRRDRDLALAQSLVGCARVERLIDSEVDYIMLQLDKLNAEDIFGRVAYTAKPSSRVEEVVLLVHSLVLKRGFNCTGAHEDEPEGNRLILVPQKWSSLKDESVYSFRYRSADRKFTVQLKMIVIGSTA